MLTWLNMPLELDDSFILTMLLFLLVVSAEDCKPNTPSVYLLFKLSTEDSKIDTL